MMKMSKYEELLNKDWTRFFEDKLKTTEVCFDENAKFKSIKRLNYDLPWVFNRHIHFSPMQNQCDSYQHYFTQKMGFIHTNCHTCYKIVFKPKTIIQLFKLYDLQDKLEIPGKCGIEARPFVPRLYGGYWYTRSLAEGREKYKKIYEEIAKVPELAPLLDEVDSEGKSRNLILKKGCTEFEMKFGDSDKWEILPEQDKWEKRFTELHVVDCDYTRQPDYLIAYIQRKWIHWAVDNDDETYLELTGGMKIPPVLERKFPLVAHSVTYHDKKEDVCRSRLSSVKSESIIQVVSR